MPGNNNPNASSPQKAKPDTHPLDRYSVQPKQDGGNGDDQSPYFKSAAPSISLPKGGGALKGIDEKFTVNAVNGTSSLQVGLPLTPGRGGFTPALSLSYNSGGGNSEFGLGWSLSLPAIQRKTDKRLPEYNDAHDSDVFLLAGAEDLVPELDEDGNEPIIPLAGTYRIRRYRPRIEGLFARIEYIRDTASLNSWWRITTKDNITTYYGLTAGGRIADPENAGRIFKWLPQIVCDHKGNVQEYVYKDEDLTEVNGLHERNRLGGLAPIANKYLKQISYCNATPWFNHASDIYAPELPHIATNYLMTAVLDYGDHSETNYLPEPDQNWQCRNDAFSDFHAGFEIRTYRKCRRVLMFHQFDELNEGDVTLVQSLDLAYEHDSLGDGLLTEADFITTITQHGYRADGSGGYDSKALPPIILTHQPLQWSNQLHSISPKDAENAPQGLTGPYQWIDLWGEGLPGILSEQGTGWFYKRNLGDGHFTPALQVAEKPSLQGLGEALQWQDLDADGRRHLVSRDPSLSGFFELDDDQKWQPFRAFPNNANIDWKSPYTRLLDLDGDGRPDVLLTEERVWQWFRNEGTDGMVTGGQSQVSVSEERGPRLIMDDQIQRIFLADMNGDGLTDLVRIENGIVCYWPNKGYGRFGAKVTMSASPRFDHPDDYNPLYLTLADISGTGAADLIYLGNNRCMAWINQAGNGWSDAHEINPMPSVEPYSKIAVLDFLGSGTGCIVWSSPLPQHAHAPIKYIDLMGGAKPYLMLSYQNGMGKEVSLTYQSSSKYYLDDKVAGRPWATRLPFPVQCVSEITTTDEVSETVYTQSFNYHHGYYDHEEREFRALAGSTRLIQRRRSSMKVLRPKTILIRLRSSPRPGIIPEPGCVSRRYWINL
jgi:hypothetical protein